jgi:hypothetical protein
MKDTVSTIDHNEIKSWTEERKGAPASLKEPSEEASNLILRILFNGDKNVNQAKEISWEQFFKLFEQHQLALVYKHENFGGKLSNSHRFVFRDEIE